MGLIKLLELILAVHYILRLSKEFNFTFSAKGCGIDFRGSLYFEAYKGIEFQFSAKGCIVVVDSN